MRKLQRGADETLKKGRNLLRCMSPEVAKNGQGAMSDLSPQCASKRTSGFAERSLIRPRSATLDQHVAAQATGRAGAQGPRCGNRSRCILRGDERHVSRDSVSPMIELTIPQTSATATAATCTSEVGLVAAPPIAPCGQIQRRKGNNGQPK